MTRNTRKKFYTIILLTNIVLLVVLCVIVIFLLIKPSKDEASVKEITDSFASQEQNISENFHTLVLADGTTSTIDYNTEYVIKPGYTFFQDKGNMQLYADITPTDSGKQLIVAGKQVHMDKHMKDADISTIFVLDNNDLLYHNPDDTMTIEYKGKYAVFTDRRTTVSLPFTGELVLVMGEDIDPSYVESASVNNIATPISENEEGTTTTSVGEVKVDEYSESSGNNTVRNFNDILTPSNERQTFNITAKFVSSASNSGTKYQEIHTGTYFYAFGQSFPYDSNECDTVTISAVYRGNEKHFNGLEMGDEYPCFVINSIRKPSEEEVR